MAHHRCTRCKQEAYPRYKYKKSGVAGVYCDDCLRIITHRSMGLRESIGRFFGGIWGFILDLVTKPFRGKHKKGDKDSLVKAKMKTANMRAREIPINPAGMVPQKR